MFMNSISASRSNIIDECLWKYYLKYVEKIEGAKSANEEALNFGSFIHKVFELGYTMNDPKTLHKIAESEKKTYKIQFQMNDKITKCIENFVLFNGSLGDTVATEKMYELPLDDAGGIKFIAIIDRVIKGSDGGYLVIDYKTSKRQKSKKDLLDDKQLMGYAYVIHKVYGVDIHKIVCAHYYPLTNTFVPVRYSKLQIFQWRKKEIDKVWRIRKKKNDKAEFPAQKNIFCDYCEYQCEHCPKFSSEESVAKKIQEAKELKKSKVKLNEVVDQGTSDKDPEDTKPNQE